MPSRRAAACRAWRSPLSFDRRRAAFASIPLALGAWALAVALATPARAASVGEGDVLHVWLTTATLEASAAALLPQPVPGLTGVSLVALTYCGPGTPSGGEKSAHASATGRFLALLTTAPKTGASSSTRDRALPAVLDGRDCKAGVGAAAKRLSALEGAPEGAVAEVQAEVKALALRLALGDAALVLASGRKVPAGFEAWAPADAGKITPAVAWSDISLKGLPLDLTPERKLLVNATAGFVADGVDVVVALADKRGSAQPSREPAARADMPAAANARFALGWDMAGEILRKLESPGPFLIETQQETFELSHLSLAGNGAGAKARGTVRARSVREDFQITVTFGDADLKVTDIRVEPRLADCAALGFLQRVGCNSQNAARSAAAAAATSSLANRYQGQLLRKLVGTQIVKVDLGGLLVAVQVEPLSFSSAVAGLAGATLVNVEPLR
jgi:hypothetical protein